MKDNQTRIDAIPFIRKQGSKNNLLRDYHIALPNLQSLVQLCNVIRINDETATAREQAGQMEGAVNSHDITGVTRYTIVENMNLAKEAERFINAIGIAVGAHESEDDLTTTLQELKHLSLVRPALLLPITEELTELIGHTSRNIRSTAYELILRLMRYSPKCSTDIVPAYIAALESSDPGVVVSALEKLPDISPLAQEKLTSILQAAFCLGLYSNLAVNSYIIDTISVLNAQAGY